MHKQEPVIPSPADATVATVGVYEQLASIYDYIFGPLLQPGRVQAIERFELSPGASVLEVGVGTGINLGLYPRECSITGIDLSGSMLDKAHERIARHAWSHIQLLEMDAARLNFADHAFDTVYAPYLVSVVGDPIEVAHEMRRVCRPGGRIVILNHFLSANPLLASLERAINRLTLPLGFKSDLDLWTFLEQADLKPWSIEKVNWPRMWSLVTCRNDG